MRDWVDVLWLESFLCARVDFFLCEYLGAPLCDKLCGLIVHVFVVLYFYDVVWCDYFVARGHVDVPSVCGPSFHGRSSVHADVGGDGFVC